MQHESKYVQPIKGALFCYMGGKHLIVDWLLQYLPDRGVSCYVEPFAGSAALFFNLPKRYKIEVLNDLDGHITNLYRVLQNPETYAEFNHRITYTLYSRADFERAVEILKSGNWSSDVERAWAFFVRQNQNYAGKLDSDNWGISLVNKDPSYWDNKKRKLHNFHRRLANVYVENVDAIECIRNWDSEETFFYLDPPYVPESRKDKILYNHDTDFNYHINLVETLLNVKGKVMLSGYPNEIYNQLEQQGWRRYIKNTVCHSIVRVRGTRWTEENAYKNHAKRTECIWLNYEPPTLSLFE
jgi:DNA adenine methylase